MSADRLKQRLTGAVALLLLATVAWFWLLDSDRPLEPVVRESEIPQAPAIEPFSVPEPRRPAGVEPIGTVAEAPPSTPAAPVPAPAPAPKKAEPAPQPQAKPAPKPAAPAPAAQSAPKETFQRDAKDLPVAWVVQVASLSSAGAADQLKASLQAKGFKAYTQTVKSGNGQSVRVYVGPKLSREQADAQKREIDSAFKVNAMVVRFQP